MARPHMGPSHWVSTVDALDGKGKALMADNLFYRVTDLFTRGKELVLEHEGESMVLWIARLNSFEQAEVQRDGNAARARTLSRLDDKDDEVMVVVEQNLKEFNRDEITGQVVLFKYNDHYVQARDDIYTEPAWREKIEAFSRGEALLNDQVEPDAQEQSRLEAMKADYYAELEKRSAQLGERYREELDAMTEKQVHKLYRDGVRELQGRNAWVEESHISQVFYATRVCKATPTDLNHANCNHRQQLIPTRKDVRLLPDEVLTRIRDAIDELAIPLREAGNSDAPLNSSESSERQDDAEDSPQSTQKGTQA